MLATTKGTFTCIDRDFITDVDLHEVFTFDTTDGLVQETDNETFAAVLASNPTRLGYVSISREGNVVSQTGYSAVKRVYLVKEGLIVVFCGQNTTSGLFKHREAEPMNVEWSAVTPLGYYATHSARTLASLPVSYTVIGDRVFEYYAHSATPFAASKVCLSGPEIIGLFGVKTGSTLPLFVPTQKKGFWGFARRWVYRTSVPETERRLGIVFSSGVKSKAETFIRMARAGLVPAEASWAKNFETPVSDSVATPARPTFVIRSLGEWPVRKAGNSSYPATVSGLVFDGAEQGQGILSILNAWDFAAPLEDQRAIVASNCSYLLTSDMDLDLILGQFDDVYRKLYQEAVDALNDLQEKSVMDIQKTLSVERPNGVRVLELKAPERDVSGKLGTDKCWMGALTGGELSEDAVRNHKVQGFWSLDWASLGPKGFVPGVGITKSSELLVDAIGGCMPWERDDDGNYKLEDGALVADEAVFDREIFTNRLLKSQRKIEDVLDGLPEAILKWCFDVNLQNVYGQQPGTRFAYSYDYEYTSWFKTKTEYTGHLNRGTDLSIGAMLKSGTRCTKMIGTESDNIAYRFLLESVRLIDKGIVAGKRRFDVALDLDSYLFECAPDAMPSSLVSEFYKIFWQVAVGLRAGFGNGLSESNQAITLNVADCVLSTHTKPEVTMLGLGRFSRSENRGTGYGNVFKYGVHGGRGVDGWTYGSSGNFDWNYSYDATRSRRVRLTFKDFDLAAIIPTAKVVDGVCNMFKWAEVVEDGRVVVRAVNATDMACEITADVTAKAIMWLILRLAEYGDLANLKAFGKTGTTYLTPQLTAMLTEFGMDKEALASLRAQVQAIVDGNIPVEDGDGELTGSQKWIDAGNGIGFCLPDGTDLEAFRTSIQAALDELDDFTYEGEKPWYVEEQALGRAAGVFDASTIPYYGLY